MSIACSVFITPVCKDQITKYKFKILRVLIMLCYLLCVGPRTVILTGKLVHVGNSKHYEIVRDGLSDHDQFRKIIMFMSQV